MNIKYDRHYYSHLLVQGTSAIVFMFFVLFSLDRVGAGNLIWAAGASTLASTCFIVFSTPHIESAKPYRILVGYLIALVCGHAIRASIDAICQHQILPCYVHSYHMHIYEIAAAVSLGFTFLLMVLLRSAHPPAAGLSIVMVLDISNLKAVVIIFIGCLLLALIRFLFRKSLQPLI